MKKVDLIVDLQYGSTGKGLIAGVLALENGYDTVINANMPNAGHTFINAEGRKWIHKVIPNGIVSPGLKTVMIGPGSVFSWAQFCTEWDMSQDLLHDKTVLIHPNAVILTDEHATIERASLSKISSTMQGSAAAMVQKIMRNPDHNPTIRALQHRLNFPRGVRVASHEEWMVQLVCANRILAEAAQGFSLGINTQFYPYCTSRDCTPPRFLADMGIPHTWLDRTIGTLRTHPIRVGNTSDGHSGEMYGDQVELTWEQLGVEPELTTVTKRVRRVFNFSMDQLHEAVFWCQPTEIFLNFCNYLSTEGAYNLVEQIDNVMWQYNRPWGVTYTGWGPTSEDVVCRAGVLSTRVGGDHNA